MSTLYFKVQSDWEEVVRLRNEIDKLKKSLSGVNPNDSSMTFEKLNKQLSEMTGRLRDLVSNAAQAGAQLDMSLKKSADETARSTASLTSSLKGLGVAFLGGMGLKAFGSQVMAVRGQFQQMEQSMLTMLGSKEKADKLMAEVRDFAKISPLDLKSTVSATQMMVGFNIEAEKVPKFLRAIGDVSQGSSQKFNSLTLAFSQMSAAGKLMGQDLNQMINAGFNPLSEISRTTGKSIATLKEEMSKGAISAEMVQNAFISATSAGGKFYKMSEEGAKTINGQMSMLQDAMDNVFNEIGMKSEGVILTSIQTITKLVENYDRVGIAIGGLVAAYGVLKAAELTEIAMQTSLKTALLSNVTTIQKVTAAWKALQLVISAHPYAAIAAALVAAGAAMYAFADKTTAAEREQKRLSDRTEEQNKLIQNQRDEIDRLISTMQDETATTQKKTEAFNTLKNKYPEIFGSYRTEKELIDNITEARKKENEEIEKKLGLLAQENISSDKNRLNELNELKQLEAMGESGRRSQGKQGRFSTLYDKYHIRSEKGFFQSDESYIQDLIKETENTIKDTNKQILEKERSVWDASLTDMTKSQAQAEREYLNGIKTMMENSGMSEIFLHNDTQASNVEEIKRRIEKLDNEIINVETKTASQYLAESKKAWEDAQKEVERVKNSAVEYKSLEDYQKALKKATDAEEAAKKTYKDLGGDVSKSKKTEDNYTKKINEQNKKIKELEERQSKERLRIEQDLDSQMEQARIDSMNDSFEKTEAQRALNNAKEIQSLERQKEDYITAYMQSLQEIWDAQEELKARQNQEYEKKDFDPTGIVVNTDVFDNMIRYTKQKQENQEQEEERKKWQDYYIQYGDYLQKRNALVEKYDDELAQVKKGGADEQRIIKERDNALDELDMSIQNSTNLMAQLFADSSKKSVNEIQDIIDKTELLITYLQTAKDESGNVTIGGKTFNDDSIASEVGISKNQLETLKNSPTDFKNLADSLENLKQKLGQRSPFKLLQVQIKDAMKLIGDENNKQGIALGIQNIGQAISDFAPALSQMGQDLGNIFGSSELGDKISAVAEGIGGLGQTAQGVGQIMSGDVVGGAMSMLSGISSVVSSVEGLFGADYSEYNKLVEEYDSLIEVWDELIDRKKEYISMSWGDETLKATTEAVDLIGKETDAWKELGLARLNAGASAGSHSIGVRMAKDTSDTDWQGIARALGVTVERARNMLDGAEVGGRMQGLFNLSSEQLKKLQEEAPAFWAKMDEDVRKYLNGIISGAEQVEEVNKMAQEQLTQISFDSMYDSFLSELMNMKSSSRDVAEDISEYFMQAMLSNRIGEMYREKLKAWYDKFANSMEGGLTTDEMSQLREEYLGYVKEALEERNTLAEITGYKSSFSQSASSRGFQTMSQDTGNELNGRFTALQESGQQINQKEDVKISQLNLANATISDIRNINFECRDIASDTRDIMADMYLEVREINQNTGDTVKCLKQMQADITEIRNNTK